MKYLIALLLSIPTWAALNEVDKQFIAGKNLLSNGGFENGRAGTSVSGTGADAPSLLTATAISGRVSLRWVADGADQIFNLGSVSYYRWNAPAGRNGVAYCTLRSSGQEGNHYKLQVFSGSNVLVEQAFASVASALGTQRVAMNFIYPTTETDSPVGVTLRVYSLSAGPNLDIDDCFVGDASEVNVSAVQPQDVFSAYVDGTAAATTPATVSNENVDWINGSCAHAATGRYACTFVSGIFTVAPTCIVSTLAGADGAATKASIRSTSSTSATVVINNSAGTAANESFVISCQKAGVDSVQPAYRPDQSANSWSGYHDSTCSWARTNTAYGDPTADATCGFTELTNNNFGTVTSADSGGSKLPGIVFTPARAGRYLVCAKMNLSSSAAASKVAMVADSTEVGYGGHGTTATNGQDTICAIVVASSTASKTVKLQTAAASGSTTIGPASAVALNVMWSIFAIDQQLPAPLLVNSVVNPRNGVTTECGGTITNSGSPAVSNSDGNCLSVSADNGAGDTTLAFAAGTFSGTPSKCTCTGQSTGSTIICIIDTATALSSTAVRIITRNAAGTKTDADFHVDCRGPK